MNWTQTFEIIHWIKSSIFTWDFCPMHSFQSHVCSVLFASQWLYVWIRFGKVHSLWWGCSTKKTALNMAILGCTHFLFISRLFPFWTGNFTSRPNFPFLISRTGIAITSCHVFFCSVAMSRKWKRAKSSKFWNQKGAICTDQKMPQLSMQNVAPDPKTGANGNKKSQFSHFWLLKSPPGNSHFWPKDTLIV